MQNMAYEQQWQTVRARTQETKTKTKNPNKIVVKSVQVNNNNKKKKRLESVGFEVFQWQRGSAWSVIVLRDVSLAQNNAAMKKTLQNTCLMPRHQSHI